MATPTISDRKLVFSRCLRNPQRRYKLLEICVISTRYYYSKLSLLTFNCCINLSCLVCSLLEPINKFYRISTIRSTYSKFATRRRFIIPASGSNGIDIELSRHHTVSVSNFQSIEVLTDDWMINFKRYSWIPGIIEFSMQ